MKKLIPILLILTTALLFTLAAPTLGSDNNPKFEEFYTEEFNSMTADLFDFTFKIKHPGKGAKILVEYKNMNEEEFKTIDINIDTPGEELQLSIPKEATSEPGFEYRLKLVLPNGKEVISKVFKVITKVDPLKESAGGEVGNPYYFYDIDRYNGYLPDDTYVSPGIARSPFGTTTSETFPGVTSKFAELRTLTPTPHNGTDFGVENGTPIHAVIAGKVAFVNPTWDPAKKGAGRYVILGHGVQDAYGYYPYYSRYLHLSEVATGLTVGTSVTKGQQIGKSGDSGAAGAYHLDLGFLVKWGDTEDLFMPPERFFNTTNWNSEKDLGFIQVPVWNASQNSIDVNVYPKGTNDGSTVNVSIMVKPTTSSTWTEHTMTGVGNNTYRFNPSSYAGQTIDYYIKVIRPGYDPTKYITRPYYKTNEAPLSFYRRTI